MYSKELLEAVVIFLSKVIFFAAKSIRKLLTSHDLHLLCIDFIKIETPYPYFDL